MISTDPYQQAVDRELERITPTLRCLCAWHHKNFGVELVMREGEDPNGPVTSSICEQCREILYPKRKLTIKTSCVCPPIPIRNLDWQAIDDRTYDGPGSPMGTGATEQEAIDDLLEQLDIKV
jgi:hypothetical protein